MFFWFIANGMIFVGSVDSMENDVATVEFQTGSGSEYRTVNINKENCVPEEGQRVLFNNIEIISCLKD